VGQICEAGERAANWRGHRPLAWPPVTGLLGFSRAGNVIYQARRRSRGAWPPGEQ